MHIATNTSSGKIDISSELITAEIAKEFSDIFENGDLVFLIGDMGVGKTTFVRYLINEFQKKNNFELKIIFFLKFINEVSHKSCFTNPHISNQKY